MAADWTVRIWVGGALLGMAAALAHMVVGLEGAMSGQGAVRIGGVPLDDAELRRHLAELRQELGRKPTLGEARALVEELVDEELLFRRALELGLQHSDGGVRRELVLATVRPLALSLGGQPPGEGQLAAWYQSNSGDFRAPTLALQVHEFPLDGGEGGACPQAAEEAARLLRLRQPAQVPPRDDLPQGLEFLDSWQRLLGQRVASVLELAPPGTVLGPAVAPATDPAAEPLCRVVLVRQRSLDMPPLERVRGFAEEAWREDQVERALDEMVARLREEAGVQIDERALGRLF